MKLNIYISTCNKYLDLLKPFSFLFNRFWDKTQEVTILGYKKPKFGLPDNFKFVSFGNDDNVHKWSTDLRKFFSGITDEYFIYGLEDYFLKKVNTDIIDRLITYIEADGKIGRVQLGSGLRTHKGGSRYKNVVNDKHLMVIEAPQTVKYRVSTQFSIWRKEYMLKYLLPGQTPWEFEMKSSQSAKNDGYRIIGTRGSEYAVEYSIAKRKNESGIKLSFDKSIIKEMKGQNII